MEEAQRPLAPAAELRQVGSEARHEISRVHAGQADEKAAYRVVADLEEDDDPEDRDEQERDGHAHVDPRVGTPQPVPAHREPVHAVRGERQRRHVERGRLERAEKGQAGEQVDTGDELHEPGHPDAPHARREVNGFVAFWVAEKLLRAVYQEARPQAHETDGQGWKGTRAGPPLPGPGLPPFGYLRVVLLTANDDARRGFRRHGRRPFPLPASCNRVRGADVDLGALDARILTRLAKWELGTCAVVAGEITRAHYPTGGNDRDPQVGNDRAPHRTAGFTGAPVAE